MHNLQYINGQWRPGRSQYRIQNFNPYDGALLAEMQGASIEDAHDAYHAAQTAQPAWAATPVTERAAILANAATLIHERRNELIDWTIRETGAVRRFAEAIWHLAYQITKAAAEYPLATQEQQLTSAIPGKESRVYRKPLGVIGVITPWNAPLILSARAIAPALALGNTVVLKPASDTPITGGLIFADIYEQAGLPKGLLNVVVGKSDEIGDTLVTHPIPSLISFTGSTAVGRSLYSKIGASHSIKRLSLELGGNSPFVVLDDANIEQAVNALLIGRFLHQGQICMSANRAIVDAKIFDQFVEQLITHIGTLAYGDPNNIDTVIGPLINKAQVQQVLAKIEKAKAQGATLLAGGPPIGSQHNIIPPHVFIDVEPDFAIAQEESFGPLLPILKARDEAHALALANDTEYGLSSAVFTADIERGRRFAHGIRAGMSHINDHPVADAANAPFGGEKNSGIGRFNGPWVIDEFTRTHWITAQSL